LALAAVALLELAAAVYVVTHNDAPKAAVAGAPAAQQRSSTSPTSSAGSSFGIDATSASRGGGSGTGAGTPSTVVAFLGDDWTAGIGASAEAKRFTTLTCAQLHLQERNFGVDRTGYAKSANGGGAYGSRVAAVVAAQPEVVVVSGGRNDRDDSAATAAHAAHELFATLHEQLPHAVLIAVAPFWGDSDLPPEIAALAGAVETAVTDVGGTYLDLPDPIHGHPDFMADAGDPNNAGYAAIAAALESRLAPLLPR
jgi:lysophospholipase L1-like esterase